MIEKFSLGDIIRMKKPHACGENRWIVTRNGADIKIKCAGCGHIVMMDRIEFMKKGKKVLQRASGSEEISAEPDKA